MVTQMTLITSATISYASGVYISDSGVLAVCNNADMSGCFQYTMAGSFHFRHI